MKLETRDGYGQGGSYWMYSSVGIKAKRLVCSMLTLEAVMSGEVHSWCSCLLDYERGNL